MGSDALAKVQYYKPSDVGAYSLFNPIDYYINASFDATQNPYYFSQNNYFKNHEELWKRLKDPDRSIKKDGGYKKFFERQFIGKRAVPNYLAHLMEGGYHVRKLEEWYQVNGYSHPRALAIITRYLGAIGNEAVETSNRRNLTSHDHIADLLFFDPAGIILFNNDRVGKFFIEDLGGDSWHFQPMFNLSDRHVYNAATNLILRPPIENSTIRPFFLFGMQGLLGAAMDYSFGTISVGAGIAPTDPIEDKKRLSTGIFYDVNGNLMSSLFINSTSDYRVRLNLYPGIIGTEKIKTGVFYSMGHHNEHELGVNLQMPIGILAILK